MGGGTGELVAALPLHPPPGRYKVLSTTGNAVGAEVEIEQAAGSSGEVLKARFPNPVRKVGPAGKSGAYRAKQATLLSQVSDALDAVATSVRDTDAFHVSDWFTGSPSWMADSGDSFDAVVQAWYQEPISIFNRMLRRFPGLTIVVTISRSYMHAFSSPSSPLSSLSSYLVALSLSSLLSLPVSLSQLLPHACCTH